MRMWTNLITAGLVCLFLTASTCYGATIYACKKKIGGTIRVVRPATTCLSTETKMSWNSEGPQGPPGPMGTACWDTNSDGACDSQEDKDNNGSCDALDCNMICKPDLGEDCPIYIGPDAQLRNCDLRGLAPIYAKSVVNADMTFANLDGNIWPGVDFNGANLKRATLRNADLSGRTGYAFTVSAMGADFSGATLDDKVIQGVFFLASFTNARIRNASITANCAGATFDYADLSNTEIYGANFIGNPNASFVGTNFSGATIEKTSFCGIDLSTANMTAVVWKAETRCPDCTLASDNGNTCAGHLTPLP